MEKCDDYAFGKRFMLGALVALVPVWIGLLISFMLGWPLFAYLISLACTIPPSLTIVFFVGRKARCPRCWQSILVNWHMREYNRGGMLRYICNDCNVEWATHLFPGGYTD